MASSGVVPGSLPATDPDGLYKKGGRMKKITRVGVFETNSSSSHSISISATGMANAKLIVEKGVCEIYDGEFGWGVEVYHDAASKAAYAYTYARDNTERMEMLERVIKKVTGCDVVKFISQDGYIDHQSSDTCAEAFASDELLKHFIFNPKSVLVIDNDNH